MERSGRELDVVVFGATGFTGRLVAERLARTDGANALRWGLAGRSRARLEAVRAALAEANPEAASLPILEADSEDAAGLEAMAARTAVVCSTVGPYARHGSPLVEACVAQGTDYCDLAGEVPWMQRMVEAHHARAERTGARIVHACGFDSVPSDLGTWALQSHALRHHGAPCTEVELQVVRMRGGASGGTIASMVETLHEVAEDPAARKAAGHPYALNPPGQRSGPDGGVQQRATRRRGVWTGPFVMATINERVVRRTNALTGHRYGTDFRYREAVRLGRGFRGALRAHGYTAGLGLFVAAMSAAPTRRLLQRLVLPDPGEGPSRERIAAGFFELSLLGTGIASDGRPFALRERVAASGDPGYGATAVMLAEAATCLARERGGPGGVLTPAVALGDAYLARLGAAGMTFEVEDVAPEAR